MIIRPPGHCHTMIDAPPGYNGEGIFWCSTPVVDGTDYCEAHTPSICGIRHPRLLRPASDRLTRAFSPMIGPEMTMTTEIHSHETNPATCDHDGEQCPGAHYCATCGAGPLRMGYLYGDSAYCNSHHTIASEADVDDNEYWTEWELDDDCGCPPACPCQQPGERSEYTIDVDVTLSRTYFIIATSPADALAQYQQADFDRSDCLGGDELTTMDEQPQTARVAGVPWPSE